MEFKTLQQEIKKMGLELLKDDYSTCIFYDKIVCSISEREIGVIDTEYSSFSKLPILIKKELIRIICEYTATDLEDRNLKRYYLQHKYLANSAGNSFLNVSEDFTKISLGTNKEYPNKKKKSAFTKKELEALKVNLKSNLDEYIIIEKVDKIKI